MATRGEQYKYRIELRYVNSSNVEVSIDSLQLQYILIDKDFDNMNMPVITLFGSVEKNILDVSMIVLISETIYQTSALMTDSST